MQWIKNRFSRSIGLQAEQNARSFLEQNGLRFFAQNYHCRQGEIDLIMLDGDEWVFVEVKYRRDNAFGQAMEYFHQHKRKKVERAMQQFLHDKRLNPSIVAHRIDLVAIDHNNVQWLKSV